MRKFLTLTILLAATVSSGLQAQFRYLDPIFEVGDPIVDTFGVNIDPFQLQLLQAGVPTAMPARSLEMDVYQPVDDNSTELRPVVAMFHTGNFLPQFVNRGILGSRKDSAIVEIINRLVERGYVGISADYREGWNPNSPDADVRTSTLLQAAYRGGQDAHMLARYLRKTVVEQGNPYRIDTSRIVFWGAGTGGYVTMTHAFLDSIPEILADDRFYDLNDQPYVNVAINADPRGLLPAEFAPSVTSNIPNHVEYNSTVAMSVNMEGALGDLDWIEGKSTEPMVIAMHSLTDENAPFSFGNVIVPTTGELVITGVAGSEQIIEKANMVGINDRLAEANSTNLSGIYGELARALNVRREARKSVVIDPDPDNITGLPDFELSHDNLLTIVREDSVAGLYNWHQEARLRAAIAFYNTLGLPMLDADATIASQTNGNPGLFSAANARTELDTIMAHFLPRAYIGLDLEGLVSTKDVLRAETVGLQVFPNPAAGEFTVRTREEYPIRAINVIDFSGRNVASYPAVNRSTFRIERNGLPRGTYFLRVQLDEGVTTHKLLVH